MAPGFSRKRWKNCAPPLKPLRPNGFSFDGLRTPTSNLNPTKLLQPNHQIIEYFYEATQEEAADVFAQASRFIFAVEVIPPRSVCHLMQNCLATISKTHRSIALQWIYAFCFEKYGVNAGRVFPGTALQEAAGLYSGLCRLLRACPVFCTWICTKAQGRESTRALWPLRPVLPDDRGVRRLLLWAGGAGTGGKTCRKAQALKGAFTARQLTQEEYVQKLDTL